jgi:hypothetical protein
MVKKSNLKEKLHWIFGNIMAIIAVILVIVIFGGAYYLVIAPNLVSKPFIEKPFLPEDALDRIRAGEHIINSSHINYLINEIGAYKLRKQFGTKNYPIMEFLLIDINERYYTFVKDNKPVTKEGNAKDEDIIIKANQEAAFNILKSENIQKAVKEANNNGKIQVELISDMKTLAAKGYLSIYDSLR